MRSILQLSVFLDNQTRIAQQQGSLQGIPLTGLGSAGLEIISRYVDVTGDIQVAAILGSTCRRPTPQVTRWIEDYRDLLDAWALYRARVMFDMSRGNISRWYGDEVKTLKQVIVRCNFCQKNITGTGNRTQTLQNKTRVSTAIFSSRSKHAYSKTCRYPDAQRVITVSLAVSSACFKSTWFHQMDPRLVSTCRMPTRCTKLIGSALRYPRGCFRILSNVSAIVIVRGKQRLIWICSADVTMVVIISTSWNGSMVPRRKLGLNHMIYAPCLDAIAIVLHYGDV